MNDKRTIFSTISLNSTVKGEKIAIERPFWLVRIQKDYPPIQRKMRAFELRYGRKTKRYKESLKSLSPSVRALMDAVGTMGEESADEV